MATFIPTLVSGGTTPDVSIKLANGYTYEQFMSSLTSIFYFILEIVMEAKTFAQVTQNYEFNYKDSTGKISTDVIPFVIDPDQTQKMLEILFTQKQYILNGQIALKFTLLAHSSIKLYLNVIEFNPADLLRNVKAGSRGFLFVNEIQNYLEKYRDTIDNQIVPDLERP